MDDTQYKVQYAFNGKYWYFTKKLKDSIGKNLKIKRSTDLNKAETVGKISKINSLTGTFIQQRRVLVASVS